MGLHRSLVKNIVVRNIIEEEEGLNQHSNITKNIEGIALCRYYSSSQLRRMKQLQKIINHIQLRVYPKTIFL